MTSTRKIPVYSLYHDNRHSPLALGLLAAYARTHKSGALNEVYDFVRTPVTDAAIARTLVAEKGAGILLCSDYMWSIQHNLEIARLMKQQSPGSIAVHGGPSVPKYDYECEAFFAKHPDVDVAVRGEGELAIAELLETLAARPGSTDLSPLAAVRNLTYRAPGGQSAPVRTEDRPRVAELDVLPSPYLTDWFRAHDAHNWVAAILETNRGCPYGCTFCDWGSATLQKIHKFSMERVAAELEWIARHEVGVLWIADANFGIFDRDVEIAARIAELKHRYGYPRQVVVNYAKNATSRLAEIIGRLHTAGVTSEGIVSIQTQDAGTLQIVKRSNIKTERYDELLGVFRSRNLPISSDLMIGLPGATVDSFKADLQFFFDRRVFAKAYPTMVLPNSPMAHRDYMEKYAIKLDREGHIVSTYSYTRLDRWTMHRLYALYTALFGFSVLKYAMYYLQIEHGIGAMTLVHDLQRQLDGRPDSMPLLRSVVPLQHFDVRQLTHTVRDWHQDDWTALYAEVRRFLDDSYGTADDEGLTTVLEVQALLMPAVGRTCPSTAALPHDIVTYFSSIWEAGTLSPAFRPVRRLQDLPPGSLAINDPHGLCGRMRSATEDYATLRSEWELDSPLMFSEGVRR